MIGLAAPETARALVCCLLLAAATWLGSRSAGRAPSGALAVAGGLLVAMVTVDLAPDALAEGAQQGPPSVVLVATACGVGSALAWLLRPSSGAPGHHLRVRAAAAGLAGHRVLEGATLGLAAAVDLRAGALVLVALVLHGGCEGAVLAVTADDGRCSPRTRTGWLALLCAAPVLGVVSAPLLDAAGLRAVATASMCGLLLTIGVVNLRRAQARLPRHRSAALGAAGAGLLVLTLHLAP